MKLFAVFSRGAPKKGGPEATASLASPNIHHCAGLPKFILIFNKFINLLLGESCLQTIFPRKFITANRRCPTLSNILFKSRYVKIN